jgi:ubiquinone/menaquinone biosynthesis C-methylase UbiE
MPHHLQRDKVIDRYGDLEYHLGEFQIAKDPSHPSYHMPVLPEGCSRILDIGCGAGQTLFALNIEKRHMACGIDVDRSALKLGQSFSPNIWFGCAQGENLPFRKGSFDFVLTRVALPYMHIPKVVKEIARVLAPNGKTWITLHSFMEYRPQAVTGLCSGNPTRMAYHAYILVNSLFFHVTGKMFRYPLNRLRCESFQTTYRMKRILAKHGFANIRVTTVGRRFQIEADRVCN